MVENYRSVSILSHALKLFESLVLGCILLFISLMFMDKQHGFRPDRLILICNIIFCNYIFDAFSAYSQVDVIYTDFAKAFDRVNHHTLLKIFDRIGISDPLLFWFDSFLICRKQCVKIQGVISSPVNVPSGVSQGDLSPILFSLFMNSANRVLYHSQLFAFANDMKIFFRIDSINDHILL